MKRISILLALLCALLPITAITAKTHVLNLWEAGIKPNTQRDCSARIGKLLARLPELSSTQDTIVLNFKAGEYHFHAENAATRSYFISNHDQTPTKQVALPIEHAKRVIINGNGAQLVFHGRTICLSIIDCQQVTVRDLTFDFTEPQITQVELLESNPTHGTTFRTAPWVKCRIGANSKFESYGEGWTIQPNYGIAFDKATRHMVYRTGDLAIQTDSIVQLTNDLFRAPKWHDSRLKAGTVVVLRSGDRPTPALFLANSQNTRLENIAIHYAEGMGLLAQLCENITLDRFRVCLKGDNDPRYFTTQADATHFSSCKGLIRSENGLYESMMDDAINVHGTYLKLQKIIDSTTVEAQYMHPQSWGFEWGYVGDSVQFIRSRTMDHIATRYAIAAIEPVAVEGHPQGLLRFRIQFDRPLDESILATAEIGLENLTWTPEVEFANNIIRNNRARGALFSTPRRVVVQSNTFDHTSGSAIVLCGDCNGWYETGACREVTITGNRFINSLTSLFQFTRAVISIYPEIPDLAHQTGYFHSGIRIEGNEFTVFDNPLLYAKSVDGLIFRNNTIRPSTDFEPFFGDLPRVALERVTHAEIDF